MTVSPTPFLGWRCTNASPGVVSRARNQRLPAVALYSFGSVQQSVLGNGPFAAADLVEMLLAQLESVGLVGGRGPVAIASTLRPTKVLHP